ncbi:MAG: Xaa-Pro dipeptidase, partial [Pseudomonadota bacterium]
MAEWLTAHKLDSTVISALDSVAWLLNIRGSDVSNTPVAFTWTASQRGTVTTDNDGSFDMSVTNNFKCTPTGNFTLTFTNITAGQSG